MSMKVDISALSTKGLDPMPAKTLRQGFGLGISTHSPV